jgi:hypothetical protein
MKKMETNMNERTCGVAPGWRQYAAIYLLPLAFVVLGPGQALAGACKGTTRQLTVVQDSYASNARAQTVVMNESANGLSYVVVIASNDGVTGEKVRNSATLKPGADVSKLWSTPEQDVVTVSITPVGASDATSCIYRVVFGTFETRWHPGPNGSDNTLCSGAVTVNCDKSYNGNKLRWNTTFTIKE